MFYTYMWLREDGTPFYIGKGTLDRVYQKHRKGIGKAPPKELIILQEWPCEEDAFYAEKLLIAYYGRKDLGTGSLRNLTNGGEGISGHTFKHSEKAKDKIRKAAKGNKHFLGHKHSEETKKKISEATKARDKSEAVRKSWLTRERGKPWTEARWAAQAKR